MTRREFFEDILGGEEDSDNLESEGQEPGAVFVDPDPEQESSFAKQETREEQKQESKSEVSPPTGRQRRQRPKVEFPSEAMPAPFSSSSVLYVQARRVAELKFNFYKWVLVALPLNLLFFAVAYLEVPPAGNLWFVWPLGLTALFLIVQYFRAFVLKGRNLHGMIEGKIHEMAMEESRRYTHRQDG